MGDLLWMRQNGLEAAVKKLSCEIPVFGNMRRLSDAWGFNSRPDGVEEGDYAWHGASSYESTVLKDSKTRLQTSGE